MRALRGMVLVAAALWGGVACAQETAPVPAPVPAPAPAPAQPVPAPADPNAVIVQNPATQCVQPAPLVRLEDYDGPFAKTIGLFADKLERGTVHPRHYEPGVRLCSLKLGDKFVLFVHDSYDPLTFVTAGFAAGISQAADWDPSFGQGGAGYGKRYGTAFADQVSGLFFKDFAYPTIFREDPRYYRQAYGGGKKRLLHVFEHAVVAHKDNGQEMFNFSEWLGTTSAELLSNTYHPGNGWGVGNTTEHISFDILEDEGFDILREFWPEISHKLKLPFRDEMKQSGMPGPASANAGARN